MTSKSVLFNTYRRWNNEHLWVARYAREERKTDRSWLTCHVHTALVVCAVHIVH